MVENPTGELEAAAYHRIEQILMEEAIGELGCPNEAKKQVQEVLQPHTSKSSPQQEPLKKAV